MSHASIRMIVHVVNGTWRAMDRYATAEQREKYVIPSVRGEVKIAYALTEPTAGTGADLRCSVEREGATYYLSGQKHLITFGTICDYWLLFARLAQERKARRNRCCSSIATQRTRRSWLWTNRWACAAQTTGI